jgi:O-acetylserine/cysteine efflux transporter
MTMPQTTTLPLRHLLLALAVVAIWGSNFVVIKYALHTLPPLTLAVLRFSFALLPACFFLRRPQVGWRNLAGYGLFIGVGQFGLLYLGACRALGRVRVGPARGLSLGAKRSWA